MSEVILRPQNTAYTFRLGPFLDLNDAKTRMTALSITQASRRISKAGGAYAQSAQSGTLSHEANGFYPCTLSTADFDTLGSLEMDVDIAAALARTPKFQVIDVVSYNALQGTGNGLRSNIIAINDSTTAAVLQAIAANRFKVLTVTTAGGHTPTALEFQVSDYSSAGTDRVKNRSIIGITGTNMADQPTRVTGYSVVGGRGQFQVVQLNNPPANGDTFLLV